MGPVKKPYVVYYKSLIYFFNGALFTYGQTLLLKPGWMKGNSITVLFKGNMYAKLKILFIF